MVPKASVRTPMAIVLVGLVAGLLLARHFSISPGILCLLALVFITSASIFAWKNTGKWLWGFAFTSGIILCFWAYGCIRLMPVPSEAELALPQREAELTLEIQTMLRSSYVNKSIIHVTARVLEVPEVGRLRPGDLVYAKMNCSGHPEATLGRGFEINAKGLLMPIPALLEKQENREFDRYLRNIGVYYRFGRILNFRVLNPPSDFTRFCVKMNKRFQEILQLNASETSGLANIYKTMLLGNHHILSSEQRERYRETGTMHFFAISGLHIGVIATVIAQFLLLVRIPRTWSPLIGLPLIYLYVEITGAAPSAMRAFLMASFFWLSFAVQRQPSSFAALVNSAIFVLLIAPAQLWHLGFQLSYIVVASILLFGLPMNQWLTHIAQPYQWLPKEDLTTLQRTTAWVLNKMFLLFAISLSAWLASMPLCAAFFKFITPSAVLLNLLLVYPVALIIVTGILSIACSVLYIPFVSGFINCAAWPTLSIADRIVYLGAMLPSIPFQNKVSVTVVSCAVLIAYFSSLFWLHRNLNEARMHHFLMPIVIVLGSMTIVLTVLSV